MMLMLMHVWMQIRMKLVKTMEKTTNHAQMVIGMKLVMSMEIMLVSVIAMSHSFRIGKARINELTSHVANNC